MWPEGFLPLLSLLSFPVFTRALGSIHTGNAGTLLRLQLSLTLPPLWYVVGSESLKRSDDTKATHAWNSSSMRLTVWLLSRLFWERYYLSYGSWILQIQRCLEKILTCINTSMDYHRFMLRFNTLLVQKCHVCCFGSLSLVQLTVGFSLCLWMCLFLKQSSCMNCCHVLKGVVDFKVSFMFIPFD